MADGGNSDISVVYLHENSHLMDKTACLINSEWPRSMGARLRSLDTSVQYEGFPVSVLLVSPISGTEEVIGHSKAMLIHNMEQNRSCFVDTVVVAKTLRGKGYGRLIMQGTEEYARLHGVECVYLTTQNEEKFYEKLGYQRCPPIMFCGSSSSAIQAKFERLELNAKTMDVLEDHGAEKLTSKCNTAAPTNVEQPVTKAPPPPPPPSTSSTISHIERLPDKVYMKKLLA